MKTIVPDYYKDFQCIAGQCRHSCCIGWEIDIDDDSMARFHAAEGELGKKLQQCIDRSGETPHFILSDHDRCPFLNSDNLCDLIIALGEDSLCQICADHPRFRNGFSDRTELGLGLCCEAAAALILNQNAPVTLTVLEDDGGTEAPDEWEAEFFALRDNAMAIAQDRDFSMAERLENLSDFFGAPLPEPNPEHWAQIYTELERLDEAWSNVLQCLTEKRDDHWSSPTDAANNETGYEQLLVYFLYRHLPTAFDWGDTAAGIWFAILSTQMLLWLSAANPDIPLTELARMYSSEIEYSDENIEILMNLMYQD